MYATPFITKSAAVTGSSVWVETSPRWMAPDIAISTAAGAPWNSRNSIGCSGSVSFE